LYVFGLILDGFGWLLLQKCRPARADAMRRFLVRHVGEIGVRVVGAIGKIARELRSGGGDKKLVLFAPGEEDGLGNFVEAREVERWGKVGFVGGEVAHDVHDAQAVVAAR
jgi:hypothetical protein